MPLAITEEHRALGQVVRSFAEANALSAAARRALTGDSDNGPVWARIADQGWIGLHVPEELGGSGYGLAELAVVADELGRALSPAPFLPTTVLAAVLVEHGTPEQQKSLLPGLVDGSTVAGLALCADVEFRPGGAVIGTATGLLGGSSATLLAVACGADLIVLHAGMTGTGISDPRSLDPSLGIGSVNVDVADCDVVAVIAGGVATAVRVLRVLASAESAGGSAAVLDMAVSYAKLREQFGRTIGSFQAVKHHLANMLVRAELATSAAWDAARAGASAQGEIAAAIAAGLGPAAYQDNAQVCIQILGGIGFTWEHDAHLYLRRGASLRVLLAAVGDPAGDLYNLTAAGVRRVRAIGLPAAAETHRAAAREFLERYRATAEPEQRALLVDSGYLVPHWPAPFGRDAGAVEQLVIDQEFADVDLPALGITGWVLLTLVQSASSEQIDRWIRPGLAGEEVWCQLFSEPGAGSDAAAVQTRAGRVVGGWRINGQKVWTSGAHRCRRGLATVRTDPSAAKHRGVTAMVIDMHAPGVTIRPLRQINGGAEFNEVFFDDVFVPDADVVAGVNEGWAVARTTLGNERVSIGGGLPGRLTAAALIDVARQHGTDDEPTRQAIAQLIAQEQATELLNLRSTARAIAGGGPGPEGSVTKLAGAEHSQRVSELNLSIVGLDALLDAESVAAKAYLSYRSSTIAGGTSEISRNVIAERILGLPRDPLNR
jgi:alkylation response protein AidB-like acyl-CoA dehydrogenase